MLVLLMSARLVVLENFHYASVVGMCPQYKVDNPIQNATRHHCLHETETRTSWLWNLFYALLGE